MGPGGVLGMHVPLAGELGPEVRQQLAELRGTVPDDELAVQLVVKRKEAKSVAARVDTDDQLHNPLRTNAPPAAPRVSAGGSAVVPRRSSGSESGGVEMREVDPTFDLASAYEERPTAVEGLNEMRAGGGLSLGNAAAVAAAKDD